MSGFLSNLFGTKNTKNKNKKSNIPNSTGLPYNWHKILIIHPVAQQLFNSEYLNSLHVLKTPMMGLWSKSGLDFNTKRKMLHDYVEQNLGNTKEIGKNAPKSSTAIALSKALTAAKYDGPPLSYADQMKIKNIPQVTDLLYALERSWIWYWQNKDNIIPPPPKGPAPKKYTPKPSKPASRKPYLHPPTKTRGPAPKRKSSVAKKLSDQLSFQELHDKFTPDPDAQQGFPNTNKLPPITPPNVPLSEEDNDWFPGKGGRKRRKRKSRKRKSNKKKRRRTRRKYKKKTRKRKKRRKRRTRK